MPFENPIDDPALRIIRMFNVKNRLAWPKAPSHYSFIFEAIHLVGESLFGTDWTGDELAVVTWIESPKEKRRRTRFARPNPVVPNSLADRSLKLRIRHEPDEHMKDWKAERLNKDWETNARALERLNRSVDWIAEKCRDGELKAFWRFQSGGGPVLPMQAHEWNVDFPLAKFVIEGGNKRYCVEFKNPGPFECYIFFEKAELLALLKCQPEVQLIVGEADLSQLSPYRPSNTFTSMKAGKPWLPTISTNTVGGPEMTIQANNPMQPERLAQAPRCLARTRSGQPCQSPAVRGKSRCRMHGGKGSGAPKGNRNAWKHGARSGEAEGVARYIRAMARLLDKGG